MLEKQRSAQSQGVTCHSVLLETEEVPRLTEESADLKEPCHPVALDNRRVGAEGAESASPLSLSTSRN